MNAPNFALYYAGDAYSTDKKIMGRQSAGKALMKGVARRWSTAEVHGFGVGRVAGQAMHGQLIKDGFRGVLRWREAPGDQVLKGLGAVYYPAPPIAPLAHARNMMGASSYSLFGVTHTVSSDGAMDQIANLVLPPFKPWDGLICTSAAALTVVDRIQEDARAWWASQTGASRFNPIVRKVIPLGVNVPDFLPDEAGRTEARRAIGLEADEVAFLFAGRMTFHGKANPAVFYQALERVCGLLGRRLVCVEAGIYPNQGIADAFAKARATLAPSARFIAVDGGDERRFRQAWAAADVFVSLSDNIQETFGVTPVEAMAAGLPVIVSDWDGYKDTIRDGVDGYRIPVYAPSAGAGLDLAERHALGTDSYDYYIGRASLATVIDLGALTDRVLALASDEALRRRLGANGLARARAEYDWPVILDRYVDFASELGEIRQAAAGNDQLSWPNRPDPFALFADYPTSTLDGAWRVVVDPERAAMAETILALNVVNYGFTDPVSPASLPLELLHRIQEGADTVAAALAAAPSAPAPRKTRALMMLAKFGLIAFIP